MKIAIVTASSLPMPPVNGGAVENLIDIILKHNEITNEHKFIVYSCKSQNALEKSKEYKNTKFIYLDTESILYKLKKGKLHLANKVSSKYYGNSFIREVIKSLRKESENFDAIIVENRPEYCIKIREIFKGKIYLHLHNDLLNKNTKYSNEIIESVDEIYTVSNYIKNRVKTIDNNIYVKTLYNGVDIEIFNKDLYINERNSLRQKYGFKSEDNVFIFSGRLNAAKGIDKFLEAFVELPDQLNAKLLIVGSSIYGQTKEDDFLKKLKEISNKKKKNIVFTGYVDYKDIPKIHVTSDIAVIPSIWEDPSPLTVYEAMASGFPIITTNSGGIPELVNSECAIVINRNKDIIQEFKRAMIKLLKDPKLREDMSINSRNRSKEFSKEQFCLNFLKEINKTNNNTENDNIWI